MIVHFKLGQATSLFMGLYNQPRGDDANKSLNADCRRPELVPTPKSRLIVQFINNPIACPY